MGDLVEITADKFAVELSILYSTSENFTGRPVYKRAACYLHKDAADCLSRAADYALELGLRLKIFDAYRPTEAQWKLWEHTPDPEFLADPRRGSPHSRGVAVDVTLTDLEGKELDMGTPFDEFSPLSHHGASESGGRYISIEARRNRLLLLGIMTSAGWDFYRNEWWHYQLFNSRDYSLLSDVEAGTNMM